MEFLNIIFSKIIDSFFHLFKRKQQPIVRLYIEPNVINLENKDSEFALRFYVQNNGNLMTKNIILTMGFSGLEIVKDYSNFRRIDQHRDGTPSIQFNSGPIPLYPVKNRNTYIGEMTFRLREVKGQINIRYDIVAENMSFLNGMYPIKVNCREVGELIVK